MHLTVNDTEHVVEDIDDSMPLQWALRDRLGMVGENYGYGIAQHGACTVDLDAQAVGSCVLAAGAAVGRRITTTEELAGKEDRRQAPQTAWIDHDVPQWRRCQPGQLIAAAAPLRQHPQPSDPDDAARRGNLCDRGTYRRRCGTCRRSRKAIHAAATRRD